MRVAVAIDKGKAENADVEAIHSEKGALSSELAREVTRRRRASVVLARDFQDGGRESASLAARIMRGENPKSIPFKPTTIIRLLINQPASRANGLVIPATVLKRADEVIN